MQLTRMLKLRGVHLVRSLMKSLPSAHEQGRIYATKHGTFALRSTDTRFISQFHRGRSYGDEEITQIRAIVAPDAHVLFVGSHVGTLAIPVSTFARRVTAIEANPETYALLRTNVMLNARDNVTTIEIAAGEADGSIEFLASSANTGGSKRKPIHDDDMYYYDQPKRIQVAMRRLDDVVSEPVDAIVMDIEGSEYFALKGMPRILSEARVLFIEFLPHHLRNVAGVDPRAWYGAIGPDYRHLLVSSTGRSAEGDAIIPLLERMFADDQNEDAIIFSKAPLTAV